MKIVSLASSSRGNAYIVDDLLIECGMSISNLKRRLGFGLSKISDCLLSHAHADHSKCAHEIMKAGIDLYTSQGCADILGLAGHRLKIVEAKRQFKINDWTVLPFDTVHNTKEPLGFLISKGVEKLMFAIDTAFIRYKFVGLTHVMVECNYQAELLSENIKRGVVPEALKNRLIRSHFGLHNVIDFLKANDLSNVKEIHLMHLSKNNSNPVEIKKAVQEATGKAVYVCA